MLHSTAINEYTRLPSALFQFLQNGINSQSRKCDLPSGFFDFGEDFNVPQIFSLRRVFRLFSFFFYDL